MARMTPEETRFVAVEEKLDYIIAELATWAEVHASISRTQAAHTALLQQVLDEVQPQPAGDDGGGVIGDLLRKIFAALREHQTTLERVDDRLSGVTTET